MTTVSLLVVGVVLAWPPRRPHRREDGRRIGRPSRHPPTSPPLDAPRHAWAAVVGGTPGPLTTDALASAMVLLSLAFRSGCGVVEAIEAVARVSDDRVGRDLRAVSAAHRWGIAPPEAWTAAAPGWSAVGRVLGVAARAGVPPSDLLLEGAADLRAGRLAAVDVAGARTGVRLVLPLGLAFLPAFVLTSVVPLVIALARAVLGAG